jgi:hypothetical protein
MPSFPFSSIVFGMRHYMANETTLLLEIDLAHKAAMIALDVEDVLIANAIDTAEDLLQFREIRGTATFQYLTPRLQGRRRRGEAARELAKRPI